MHTAPHKYCGVDLRASSHTQLEIYPEKARHSIASSSRSVTGFTAASNPEVAGSNPPEKQLWFWFAKVTSSNLTWVLLVFKPHNFGTGRTSDVHMAASRGREFELGSCAACF